MLIDGLEGLAGSHVPVCVVGSGPVGLSLAVDLARRGVDVLLLESGGELADPLAQSLSDADRIEPERHDDMAIAVARRLGGTSNLWGGRCIPFDPVDFDERPGVEARWPIHYEDMAAYIPRAVAAMGSGDPVYTATTALAPDADDLFSSDTLERWVNVQSMARVFQKDIKSLPNLSVRLHATLTGFVFSEAGALDRIIVRDTRSGEAAELRVRHLVLAAGGLESTRLLLAAAQGQEGRFGSGDGPLGRYYMGHLYGEIADITLARSELGTALDFHVDHHDSYVRRRFVASREAQRSHGLLNASFWPIVPPIADPVHGSAILSLIYLMLRDRRVGEKLVAEAIRRRHIPDPPGPMMPHIRNLLTGLPGSALFGLRFLKARYGGRHRLPGFFVRNRANHYGLSYHGEQAPNASSRVWLRDTKDRLGLPRLAIDLRFSQADADSLVTTHDLFDQWLRRNRLGALSYRVPEEERAETILASAAHGTHQIGLARMAGNRREGVVDATLTTFDCPNLHVASTAVLPTSGQANPTLTAVALGLRLGDHLSGRL